MKKAASAHQKAWLFAILLVTAGMLLVWWKTGMHYVETDDTPTVRAFMGYEGGVVPTFHLVHHTLLTYLLAGLSTLWPGVAWYSWVQLFCIWLANGVIVKSFCQIAQQCRGRMGAGMAVSLLYFAAVALYSCALPTFTTTAAFLGAAGVAQLCALRMDSKPAWGLAGSVGLLLAAYAWRDASLWPALAFWLLGMGWKAWQDGALFARKGPAAGKGPEAGKGPAVQPSLRPYGVGVALLLVCCLAGYGLRLLDVKVFNKMEEPMAWQAARAHLFDYTDFETAPSLEALEETGWTEAEVRLVSDWYFLDPNITTEALQKQAQAQTPRRLSLQNPGESLAQGLSRARRFLGEDKQWVWLAVLSGLFGAWCLWRACHSPKKAATLLCLLLSTAGMAAFFLYLVWVDRLFPRTFLSAQLPCSALMACLFLTTHTGPDASRLYQRAQRACAVLLTALALLTGLASYQNVTSRFYQLLHEVNDQTAWNLEAYARANPEQFILYSTDDFRDSRLFPSTGRPVPHNLAAWGDWETGSQGQQYQFSLFGLDRADFSAQDFLRHNLLVMGNTEGPPKGLTEYVESMLAQPVEYEAVGVQGELCFYQYRLAAPQAAP